MELQEYVDKIAKSEDVQELLSIADEAIGDNTLTIVNQRYLFQLTIKKSNQVQGNTCALRTNAG